MTENNDGDLLELASRLAKVPGQQFQITLVNGETLDLVRRADYEAAVKRAEAWRSVALAFGEMLASVGPYGYYEMTPEQWFAWVVDKLNERGSNDIRPDRPAKGN